MIDIDDVKQQIEKWFFPAKCVHCNRWGDFICSECSQQIEFLNTQYCPACNRSSVAGYKKHGCTARSKLDQLISLTWYRDSMVSIIQRFKFAPYLKKLDAVILDLIQKGLDEEDYVFWHGAVFVPVPLSRKRQNERGYNQAEIIANNLVRLIPQSKVMSLLQKVKETSPQSLITDRKQRKQNVQGVYRLYLPKDTSLSKVVLVDDVYTSGSTLEECARVLKNSNPNILVAAFTLARG